MDSKGCIARSRIHLETPETPSYLSVHYYLLHSYAQHLHNFGIKIVFTEKGNVSIDQINHFRCSTVKLTSYSIQNGINLEYHCMDNTRC